jgi:hypothetical protein
MAATPPNMAALEQRLGQVMDGIASDQTSYVTQNSQYMRVPLGNTSISFGGTLKTAFDEYKGPRGVGYVLRCSYVTSGTKWIRSINVGPEYWRNRPWIEVDIATFGY